MQEWKHSSGVAIFWMWGALKSWGVGSRGVPSPPVGFERSYAPSPENFPTFYAKIKYFGAFLTLSQAAR